MFTALCADNVKKISITPSTTHPFIAFLSLMLGMLVEQEWKQKSARTIYFSVQKIVSSRTMNFGW